VKKLFLILLIISFTVAVSAQEFSISGEAKTGILWTRVQDRMGLPSSDDSSVGMGSLDDAGGGDGRFRINLEYTNASGNLGFKARLNWENFNNSPTNGPHWPYAFGWGSFFDNQLTLSLGKLGASPWGTGGPEMWRELEETYSGGIRFEYTPNFAPGLNVGFVFNGHNGITDGPVEDPTIWDLLLESVIGISYTHEWFMIRGAYRLDSEIDFDYARMDGTEPFREGDSLVYRIEEYALRRFVPGLSIWALGQIDGLWSEIPDMSFKTNNWLFLQYAPPSFTAQLRFGLDNNEGMTTITGRGQFSYRFLDGLIVPRITFGIAQDYGDARIVPDAKFKYIDIEPDVQINFAQGAYFAASYSYRLENRFGPPNPPEQQRQRINLRAGVTF
jgi:hypothetical protein